MEQTNTDCLFCMIIKGEVPSYKIYEDDDFYAFLDVFALTDGHTLIIPKDHYKWVWDVPNIGKYFEVCQKIAKNAQKVSGNKAIYSMVVGEAIEHAHIHIIPDTEKKFLTSLVDFFTEYKKENDVKMIDKKVAKINQDKYKL